MIGFLSGLPKNKKGVLAPFSGLVRVSWINLKTLLGKTFRLFVNQKVPDMGVVGGKSLDFFPEN
jgi:hypothetical protein